MSDPPRSTEHPSAAPMRGPDLPALDGAGLETGERGYLAGHIIANRYRLTRKLGEGGMGVVWVAHSLVLGVDVALKLIRGTAAEGASASRMAREAQAAARLGHPAMVRVFDFGWTTRGDPYLVMELVNGEALDAALRAESPMGAIRAVQIVLPLADGLRCAHERGIVHRDVKPENVFLASDSFGRLQPKLLDFGIAKMDQPEGRVTQDTVLGSPEYMSPEQARGEADIDARTDVWSMCVMLYEMTTGKVPFAHHNYNALRQSILEDDPTPTPELGGGDEALWQVIERGLAKDRDQRWVSMTELGEALALWLYEHGVKEDVSGNSIRALWLDGTLSGEAPARPLPTSRPPPRKARQPSFRERLSKHGTVAGLLALGALVGVSVTRLSRSPEAEVAPSPTVASSREDQNLPTSDGRGAEQSVARGNGKAPRDEAGEARPTGKPEGEAAKSSARPVERGTPRPVASEPEPPPAITRPAPFRGTGKSNSRRSIDDFGF